MRNIQMRFLLLAVLCLFAVPAKAAIYAVPYGYATVYGDFASHGGFIQASFSYQITGGQFYNYYTVSDPSNLPGQVVINVDVNQQGQLKIFSCNAFDAHCGRGDRYQPYFGIYGPEDEGFISINSSVSVIGATPVELSFFVNLPDGFSLTAPQIAAVPETSTWIMMLLGFAGIGFSMVKRRQPLASVS
jgi:hypothetical protein